MEQERPSERRWRAGGDERFHSSALVILIRAAQRQFLILVLCVYIVVETTHPQVKRASLSCASHLGDESLVKDFVFGEKSC